VWLKTRCGKIRVGWGRSFSFLFLFFCLCFWRHFLRGEVFFLGILFPTPGGLLLVLTALFLREIFVADLSFGGEGWYVIVCLFDFLSPFRRDGRKKRRKEKAKKKKKKRL
jgi:hypothetical protein